MISGCSHVAYQNQGCVERAEINIAGSLAALSRTLAGIAFPHRRKGATALSDGSPTPAVEVLPVEMFVNDHNPLGSGDGDQGDHGRWRADETAEPSGTQDNSPRMGH